MNVIHGIATDYGYYRLVGPELVESAVLKKRKDGNFDMRQSAARILIDRANAVMRQAYEASVG